MKQFEPAFGGFDKSPDSGRAVDGMAIDNQEYRRALVFQQSLQKFNKPVGGHFPFDRHEAHGTFGAYG